MPHQSTMLLVDVRPGNLHVPGRIFERFKSKLLVERVGISGEEHESPEVLKVRMRAHSFHHPLTEPGALVLLENVHITQIGKGCFIRDDTSKADLPVGIEEAEAKGTFYRLRNNVSRYALRPVRTRQICM